MGGEWVKVLVRGLSALRRNRIYVRMGTVWVSRWQNIRMLRLGGKGKKYQNGTTWVARGKGNNRMGLPGL